MALTLPTIFMAACILVMIGILLYISLQKPSYYQNMLTICLSAMVVWFAGYMIEVEFCAAGDWQKAIIGTRVSYIAKPFALLSMFYFLAYYANVRLSNLTNVLLVGVHLLISAVAFSSGHHKLFYTSVGFDEATHSLVLGHGPFYFVYMASAISFFIANFWLLLRSLRAAQSKEDKLHAIFLAMPIFFGVGGYFLYLVGLTGGFDTTVIGSMLAALSLVVLFGKYHLFDGLNFAKEKMLDSLSDGFIIVNSHDKLEYANETAALLFPALRSAKDEKAALAEIVALDKAKKLYFLGDLVYSVSSRPITENGFSSGIVYEFQDITDRYRYSNRLREEVDTKTRHIADMQTNIIESFAGLIEARDETTGEHVGRCSTYVSALCMELRVQGLMPEDIPENFEEMLCRVAPLHDLGKIAIPDSILKSPSRLSKEEFDVIKTHAVKGARMIEQTFRNVESEEYVSMARDVALYHHERWDGSGYPKGLKGMEIPFSAQVMSICDVYDALRSKRPYKEAYSKEKSLEIILSEKGKQFNPVITDAFIDVAKRLP